MVRSQVHGFPKVMGVLTHLDAFTDAARLRKVKKKLKARFWTEIYDGAKLFYLSGVQHGGWAVLDATETGVGDVRSGKCGGAMPPASPGVLSPCHLSGPCSGPVCWAFTCGP